MVEKLSRRMLTRGRDEPHRVSTPLELLFDLCFVAGVAQAGVKLHHEVGADHPGHAVLAYLMVFFAIWWAWMNFTWFASAFDTDDVPYRLATLVQISGVLVLAAGVPKSFDGDWSVVTLGYAIMRLALCGQWMRAARSDRAARPAALRFGLGIAACMVGWGALLLVPHPLREPGFFVMVGLELLVPTWAEHAAPTGWHPHHIAERYSLFTLIVLGESVLATTTAVQGGFASGASAGSLWWIALSGLIIVFVFWWLYFDQPAHDVLAHRPHWGFRWGYGHYFVFASAAAIGAGMGVVIDHSTGHAEVSRLVAGGAVTVPTAVLLVSIWILCVRPRRGRSPRHRAVPVAAVLVLAATLTPSALPVTAVILAALLAFWIVTAPAGAASPP
jgi:low temperature requirement protein LtrA